MTLFSIGNLYVGYDKSCYFDALIHLWNIRVEWGQSPDIHGPNTGPDHQSTDEQHLSGDEPDALN
jgi:hypothetical protein